MAEWSNEPDLHEGMPLSGKGLETTTVGVGDLTENIFVPSSAQLAYSKSGPYFSEIYTPRMPVRGTG